MEFCEICDNMLYVKTDEKNMLVKYCKHCQFEKVETDNKCAIKISKTIYSEDDLLLPIPQALLDRMGWKEGDNIEIGFDEAGRYVLKKI